jgi:hypothetical protein
VNVEKTAERNAVEVADEVANLVVDHVAVAVDRGEGSAEHSESAQETADAVDEDVEA